jgi:MFS transporter, DHA1 family, tetracycline resistance protein
VNTAAAGAKGGKPTAAMPFILITVLIDMMAIGLIVPVLPALVGKFATDPAEHTKWVGIIMFTFSLASFFATPLLGALSDRFGRRPILLLGFCGLALNFFATALATSLWMLVAARVVGGAMQANAAVANAYVADISSAEDRAKRFGQLGAMFGLGFILGPVAGGLLGEIDLRLPFVVAGCLALANLVYGYFVLPESLAPENRRRVGWQAANPFVALWTLARTPGLGGLSLTIALAGLAQFTLYSTWVLYTTFKFGWGPGMNGWALFLVGLVSALGQGLLMGRLLKRMPADRLALMAMASSAVAYLGWGLAPATWVMFLVIALNVLGAMSMSTLQSLVSSATPASQQGRTLGAVSGLNSAMAVLGPVVGTPLMATVSHYPPGDWRIGLPLYACALLMATALLIAALRFRRLSHPPAAPNAALP